MARVNLSYQLRVTSPDCHGEFKKKMIEEHDWSDSFGGKALPHTTLTYSQTGATSELLHAAALVDLRKVVSELKPKYKNFELERFYISAFEEGTAKISTQ